MSQAHRSPRSTLPPTLADSSHVFTSPIRWYLLARLTSGPLDGTALRANTKLTKRDVWHHLKVLRDTGFVVSRTTGNKRLHHLTRIVAASISSDTVRFVWKCRGGEQFDLRIPRTNVGV